MDNERRRERRIPAVSLKAQIVTRKLFRNEIHNVVPVDLSTTGISIQTARQMTIGDKLEMALILELDIGNVEIKKLPSTIRHTAKIGNEMRYGLEFDEIKNEYTRGQLERMAEMLERSRKVSKRIQEQMK